MYGLTLVTPDPFSMKPFRNILNRIATIEAGKVHLNVPGARSNHTAFLSALLRSYIPNDMNMKPVF